MANIIEMDIRDVKEGVILHIVNNKDRLGAGVAGVLAKKWPEVKENYHEYNAQLDKEGKPLLGEWSVVKVDSNLYVANLYAQDGYGWDGRCYLNYACLNELLEAMSGWISLESHMSEMEGYGSDVLKVHIPFMMGCGLAGGDWHVVQQMIDHNLPDAIICKLPEGT
jgi:hypothetical protein